MVINTNTICQVSRNFIAIRRPSQIYFTRNTGFLCLYYCSQYLQCLEWNLIVCLFLDHFPGFLKKTNHKLLFNPMPYVKVCEYCFRDLFYFALSCPQIGFKMLMNSPFFFMVSFPSSNNGTT